VLHSNKCSAPEHDDQQVLLGAIGCVERRFYCQAVLLQVNGHLQGATAAAAIESITYVMHVCFTAREKCRGRQQQHRSQMLLRVLLP
jgi:hypothetical protein